MARRKRYPNSDRPVKQQALFLDRDGVLNPDVGYTHKPEDAILFPDVVPSLLEVQRMGFLIVVVSNQSGIGRGHFSPADSKSFNALLTRRLNEEGIRIQLENFYICPHSPDDKCDCRKPNPGLLLKAAEERKLDLSRSFLIGDKESDVEAGRRAGVFTILLNREALPRTSQADRVVSNLFDAVRFLKGGPRTSDS